jgi:superfamily II DNA or RNA helicase
METTAAQQRKFTITRKRLTDWAGAQVVKDAENIVRQGLVLRADYEHPYIRGMLILNNREFRTSMRILPDGNAENECSCYANRERGIICPHVIALGIAIVNRAADPQREARYQEELRHASRLAAVDEAEYITRVPEGTPAAIPAAVKIVLPAGWQAHARQHGVVPIQAFARYRDTAIPLDRVPRDQPLALARFDDSLLYVLEDICEGPAAGAVTVTMRDFINLLDIHKGRELGAADNTALTVHATALTTLLRMDMDRENGELIVDAHTECPFLPPGEPPTYLVAGASGWVFGAGHFWPLGNLLPQPYHSIYREPVVVRRPDVVRFMRHECNLLSRYARMESDITLDLFTIDPASPTFKLRISGSPASLAATLFACYGELELVACKPDVREHFAVPDPDDLMRYTVRDRVAEAAALRVLADCRMPGEVGDAMAPIVGSRDVLNFLGTRLPALRRRGWQIELEGRVEPYFESLDFVTPVVHVEEFGNEPWFDVGFDFEQGDGASISHADVQRALLRGDAFVERNGRTLLIDAEAVESMLDVFADCAAQDGARAGHFRLGNIYAPFVKSSLDALDGIDVEDAPAWRARAGQSNRTMRLSEVTLPPRIASILRPYQKDGVSWLRFLEENGFGGILADEMGLGKTLQTLAWLELPRVQDDARGKPSLLVCPTSLVENWAEEAARFTPDLKVVCLTGADRHDKWPLVAEADLAVTSYALLRRDLDKLLACEFASAILDEAQHIKNRSTLNAQAAKQIKARHKLVLTGTPVENSVADLWSIMDFLMPGYLGRHDTFRANYELPIAHGGPEADLAQFKLRRKLHPFLMRRLKRDVARDLPPKIEKTTLCGLSSDQRTVYQSLLKHSRDKIANMVASQGFNRCRMEILTTLLRLRQACCHLDLLKLPDLKPEEPSAKMELFFELVDEALDGGHRMLVFSQFVTMLQIIRAELDTRGIPYCYLDGSTKSRGQEVHRFNSERNIPIFLISLKAGGTGLNLTGADMVIHFDPWWNPAVEDQATDRAHRIGQQRTVYSLKLIARGTVEEKVLAMQARKKAVINATIESDEGMLQALTWEDVQELLEL